MRIEHVLLGIALFLVISGIGIGLYYEQYAKNGADYDPTLFDYQNDSLNSFDEKTSDLESATSLGEVSDEDAESTLYKGGIPTAQQIFSSVPLINGIINKIAVKTGLVPDIVVDGFKWMIGILAGAFALYMIMRFKPQD